MQITCNCSGEVCFTGCQKACIKNQVHGHNRITTPHLKTKDPGFFYIHFYVGFANGYAQLKSDVYIFVLLAIVED